MSISLVPSLIADPVTHGEQAYSKCTLEEKIPDQDPSMAVVMPLPCSILQWPLAYTLDWNSSRPFIRIAGAGALQFEGVQVDG